MSEPLFIALVAEGPTDRIVIEAALAAILGERPFVLSQLQPEDSIAFGSRGGGWGGVYEWCKQAAERAGGHLSDDSALSIIYSLVLLHLDADVAAEVYSNANITPKQADLPLPCEKDCPPPSSTTNALRSVLLSWCGETTEPPNVVVCMPSKSTEAWVMASVFLNDRETRRRGIECHPNPESRLGQQPKLVRFAKTQDDYRAKAETFKKAWPTIATAAVCSEAERFERELRLKLP
jgi:hypothetical protein